MTVATAAGLGKGEHEMEQTIIEIIQRITGETFPDATGASNIVLDFGLDSLLMVTLLLNLEDEFEVSFDFDDFDFEHLKSVSDLAAYIKGELDA